MPMHANDHAEDETRDHTEVPVSRPGAEDEEEDALVFHETRKSKKVVIFNEQTGSKTRYLLVEMMGPDIEKWTKFQTVRIMGSSRRGRPDPKDADFKDFNANLIALCLWDEAGENRIPVSTIKEWPASTLNGLFDYCQTMNGLNDEGREQAKKV